jgi:molybdopterin/thiamine biosynthesis adenylyltransferase
MEFTEERLERYSRHILLNDVGVEGQERLFAGKVLIIGAGGLGAPIAYYLAAAGVGRIGVVDADLVDLSNLQRQIVHFTADVGRPKTVSAREKMLALNPDVEVIEHPFFANAENISELITPYDFVVDGTDSFQAKFLINDACVLAHKPFSHGGILRFTGQTMNVFPGEGACYRCVFRKPPPPNAVPTCSEAGVLGAVAGILGTIQAAETLKFLTGAGTNLKNTLLSFDAKDMRFRHVRVQRDPDCPVCGTSPTITTLVDEAAPVCDLSIDGMKERSQ